jgi:pyruvate formate-lyase/glycerol dehydratase family glycyl radical enzyme
MTDRVARLREASLTAQPWISSERAELMTRFCRDHAAGLSIPVRRARSFAYLLEHKTIWMGDGELIVGERGPSPKGTPTYPELCCHSIADLDIIDRREKIRFSVEEGVRGVYRDAVIPYWRGQSMRDVIFTHMTPEWHAAYQAGVFTEFMEQRAPGHTVLDDKIYRQGMVDVIARIDRRAAEIDELADPRAFDKLEELAAMRIAAQAIIRFAERHAEKAEAMAAIEPDATRQAELRQIAEVCRRVPAFAPRTFREALQAYWFVHLGVITELNTWDSFCPGRLDQHLQPFYLADVAAGRLSEADARELLACFWVKFNNQPAPPKVGVTAAESGTYTDFCNINSGGLTADGADGVNDVTWLVLDTIDEMRLLQPSSNVQLSARNPDRFLKRAGEIIRKGWGQPSIFNADVVVEELLRAGKSLEDARCGGTSGCVEVGAFGKEAYILTGYFNLPKVLELTLRNGFDTRTGKQVGIESGDPRAWTAYGDAFGAFERQLRHCIDIKVRGNQIIERLYATEMPAPFMSVLIDDCIANAADYNAGGARYNTTYIMMPVGPATTADSLSSLKFHVFERCDVTIGQVLDALEADFVGHEPLRQSLWNATPRYGNDDPYADAVLSSICDLVHAALDGRPNTKGGQYHVNYLSTTCHVYFGSVTGPTPDGRRRGEPVSDGISPVQGTDRRGPTAVLKSATRFNHARTGGTLLNQKFTPQVVAGEEGLDKLSQLVRAYFRMGGHHIQFNVVTAETLRAAQRQPEKHRDLIVRVAGYSDYFCDLTKGLQDEIIARTEYQGF